MLTATPTQSSAEAQAEAYVPLGGVDCSISAQMIAWNTDGWMQSGPIKLSCAGQPVRLVQNNVKDGWVTTQDFGKICIRSAGGFGMTILITPDQNQKMGEAFKKW